MRELCPNRWQAFKKQLPGPINLRGISPLLAKLRRASTLLPTLLRIELFKGSTAPYVLEAMIMPDDIDWKPWLMPVIESESPNNDKQEVF